MKKPFKKTWMIASAFTLGMAILTPLQAGATTLETKDSNINVQLEQKISGTIKEVFGDGMNLKGIDGKNYFISFSKFSTEQIEKMNLVVGQEISIEGKVVDDYSDFYTFEVYKKDLPKEVTKEDLGKLEKLFNEIKKLEKEASVEVEKEVTEEELEKKYEEMEKIYDEMYKITKPYILANWEPETFEQYLEGFGFSEGNIAIKENDKKQLQAIYEEWVKLEKSGDEEKANLKYEELYTILQPYLDELYPPQTFEEYMEGMELDIPAETMAKLKTLYEDAQKAENDENMELSETAWNQFHDLLSQFIEPLTFEEYMSDYDFEVSKEDKEQLKKLYEEAMKLDNEKADEKWEAFYNILEPYFALNKEILFFASKLTINNQDYLPQSE
ncbi:hypothetical protein ACIQXG_00045 [Lysinibacillus sphaericus]|uniref:hypothetical protein n=1 Tax=Lysinibacillus sphaericus TaxID=1421 RepID=UPI001E36640E|nr:hypothetical protein [Lysinibacillus sphaericus]MCS1382934.1 hypothetical protein [Lysinibacillus sphaericus]